ncbi:MAG: LysE family transporter [Bacteroidota bacterium]
MFYFSTLIPIFVIHYNISLLSEIIIKAIVTGFILSIMIGPVFFVLLETSIRKGVRAALCFDLGVLVSDVIYILIAYVFYSEVASLTQGENEGILKIIGGSLFLIYGTITYLKPPKEHAQNDLGKIAHSTKDYIMLFVKGLILNMANPMVIFYWFSVMALGAKTDSTVSFSTQMLIYIGILLTVFFSIDFLKIIGAKKLRPYINNNVLKKLSHITGAILFAFGIVLLLQGILSKV